MADLESLYAKLPIPLQQIACSVQGARFRSNRYGGAFPRLLREAEDRTYYPVEQIQAYRDQRLRSIIQHCANTVPYYRRLFGELGITPGDIQTLRDLQHLPILTKQEIKENYYSLFSEAVSTKEHVMTHTSGTTGSGLHFATTRLAVQEHWAVIWRFRRWHGIELDDWSGHFGSRSMVPIGQSQPPYWRYNRPGKQILFSGYHMSPANLRAYVDELRSRRPRWLHGFPSLLALLAAHVLESGSNLGYEIKWVTTTSESLLPQQANLIEQAFGVPPRQWYGMAEMVAGIAECEYGGLHVDEDYAAVEFVPNPSGPGHKVIGTSLAQVAFPFVRCDVGDLVTLTDDVCSCGRPGRVVASIDGRKEDYVILKSGARLGRVSRIFQEIMNIREAQVFQSRPGEIVIRVVRGTNYTDADEAELLRQARKRLGDDTDIQIEYVENISRTRAGKLRFVVSELEEGQSVSHGQ